MKGIPTSNCFVNGYGHLRSSLTTSQVPYKLFFDYQIPPGVDDGIIIGNLQQGTNTSQTITGPGTCGFDATLFGGEDLSGSGSNPPSENNGWWNCSFSSGATSQHTIGQASGSTSLSQAAGQIAIFKSSTANLTATVDIDFTVLSNLNPLRTADQILWSPEDSRSGFQILSSKAQPNSQSFDDGALWIGNGSTVSWAANQFAQCTLGTLTGTGTESGIGLFLRGSTSANTGYRIIVNAKTTTPNTWLSRFNAGTDTIIATGFKGSAWASGDIVYADVIDSGGNPVIRVRNGSGGSDIINFTDSSGSKLTSGNAGMAFSSTVTASSCTQFSAGPK